MTTNTEKLLDHFAAWLRSSLKLKDLQDDSSGIRESIGTLLANQLRCNQKLQGIELHLNQLGTLFLQQLERSVMTLRQEFQDQLQPLSEALKAGLAAEADKATLLIKVQGLQLALDAATGDLANFRAENQEEIDALKALLTSPLTPVGDAIATTVVNSPDIPTPEIVDASVVADPTQPTPEAQSTAAVDAIVDAAFDSTQSSTDVSAPATANAEIPVSDDLAA